MHPQEQQRLSDSFWYLQRWDKAPEEFATYLLELGALVLQRQKICSSKKRQHSLGC